LAYKKNKISKTIIKSASVSEAHSNFVHDVREILRQARGKAYAAVNFIMIEKSYALRS
jgi:hypothetical protein